MDAPKKVRIDKWIWAVRLFKTRSLAGTACQKGKVKVNDETVKASYQVAVGDMVRVRKARQTFVYKVLGIVEKRPSATLAQQYYEDHSPPPLERPKKLDSAFINFPQAYRERGMGRPTKKERRDLDKLRNLDD